MCTAVQYIILQGLLVDNVKQLLWFFSTYTVHLHLVCKSCIEDFVWSFTLFNCATFQAFPVAFLARAPNCSASADLTQLSELETFHVGCEVCYAGEQPPMTTCTNSFDDSRGHVTLNDSALQPKERIDVCDVQKAVRCERQHARLRAPVFGSFWARIRLIHGHRRRSTLHVSTLQPFCELYCTMWVG